MGIYVGGETADVVGCFKPDANWVESARAMGWGTVFIWDGLQAPCSGNTQKMSSDPELAYNQGVDAANRAFNRLGALGVDSTPSVEYLDIESFDESNISCRDAVNSFIRGWADQLAILGNRSGVYSSACAAIKSLIDGQCFNSRCPDEVGLPGGTAWRPSGEMHASQTTFGTFTSGTTSTEDPIPTAGTVDVWSLMTTARWGSLPVVWRTMIP